MNKIIVEASAFFADRCKAHETRLVAKYGNRYPADHVLKSAVTLADLDVSRKYGRNMKEIFEGM